MLERKRSLVIAFLVMGLAISGLLSACGGSSSSSSTPNKETSEPASEEGASESSESAEGGSNSELADLPATEAMIKAATEGLVYSPEPVEKLTPASFKPVTGWTGPTSAPELKGEKTLQVIICLTGTECEIAGKGAEKAAESMGWKAEMIDGKGTPEGFNEAMSTALAKQPDAILTVAVPESQISDKLAEAKEEGIAVASVASANEGLGGYDAWVVSQETVASMMEGWYAVAEDHGKANVVFLWDKSFPHLAEALEHTEEIVNACGGCKILQTYSRTLTTATNPTAMEQLTNSILQHYGGEVGWILTPYGFGVAPVIAAVRSAGEEVNVLSKNESQPNLEMVAAGEQAAQAGFSAPWLGWAGVDQLRRILAGEEPLPESEEGLTFHMFVPGNTPKNGVTTIWTEGKNNFETEYERIWGVK